jgi:uncharacterized protein YgiM (DUF1202 family)
MLALAVAALVLALPILPSPGPLATTATAAALRGDMPYRGVVLGDSVNVRSGPGTAYDVVLQLTGGCEVEVIGEAFGWLLVRPAAQVRVFVSRDLVEPKGDGIAVVTRDRVNIRSRAAAEGTVVGQANRGDVVRMIDNDGAFVAIAAPPEVCVYVHRDLVRRADATVQAGAPLAAPEAVPASAPAAPPPAPVEDAGQKLKRAREMYLAELEKPEIGSMDFKEAERLFVEAGREAGSDDVRALAIAGLRRVRAAVALQEDYRRRLGPLERIVAGDREPCINGSK